MASTYNTLTINVTGAIAHIRLTRPALHNMFDELAHAEFPAALAEISAIGDGQDIAALIVSAEGKSFSAGGDMAMMLRANASKTMRDRLQREGMAIVENLLALPCPVIAAVQGAAVGLGASIVSCCDIVVAWKDAKIADPHVVLGLVAGDGGIMGWTQSVGAARAKRYLLTGERITGAQAHAMGLISDLVDTPDAALPAALLIAEQIAALPRAGVRGTKRAFARLARTTYAAALELAFAYEMEALSGEELRQTVEAIISRV